MKKLYCICLFVWSSTACLAQADFTIINMNKGQDSCYSIEFRFKDISTGGVLTNRKWYIGKTTPEANNPETRDDLLGADGNKVTNYDITLSIDINGITNRITKKVTVYPPPAANFDLADPAFYMGCAPLTIKLKELASTSNPGNINEFEWSFAGPANPISSKDKNPDVTFIQSSDIDRVISLYVKNSWGCKSAMISKTIKVYPSVKSSFVAECISCSPAVFKFTNTSTGGASNLFYNWSFGDGTDSITSSKNDILHEYKSPGKYVVTLTSKNASNCNTSFQKTIYVGNPKSIFNLSKNKFCTASYIVLDGRQSLNADPSTGYEWLLDKTVISRNPLDSFQISTPGNYVLSLVTKNNDGKCFDTLKATIQLITAPVADFDINNTEHCVMPFSVNLTNKSTGTNLTYEWNFGDLTAVSTAISPTHPYTNTVAPVNGFYVIKLKAVDPVTKCWSEKTKKIYIKQPIIAPVSMDVFIPCPNQPVKMDTLYDYTILNLLSNDAISKYTWNFGDPPPAGTDVVSTANNQTHTYTLPGIYKVKLKILTKKGCTTDYTLIKNVTVDKGPCENDGNGGGGGGGGAGGFSFLNTCADKYSLCFKNEIKNTSVLSWTFDGTIVTTNPPGNDLNNNVCFKFDASKGKKFLVKVKRKDATTGTLGPDTESYAVIIDEKPDFVYSIKECNKVFFDTPYLSLNKLTGIDSSKVVSYEWNFGDKTTPVTIINNSPNGPFKNGDTEHIYNNDSTSQIYTVTLTIRDKSKNGCLTDLTKEVKISSPTTKISADVVKTCGDSLSVTFKSTSVLNGNVPLKKWFWNFGDGKVDTLSSNSSITHKFKKAVSIPYKEFIVTLIVEDANGCKAQAEEKIKLYKPIANFRIYSNTFCDNSTIQFYNYSGLQQTNTLSKPDYACIWDFGDGKKDTVLYNPWGIAHTYDVLTVNKTYTVKLYIKDENGCKDTFQLKDGINQIKPNAFFDYVIRDSCTPLKVLLNFKDTIERSYYKDSKFEWSILTPAGNTINLDNLTDKYSTTSLIDAPGWYELTLSIKNFLNNCSVTGTKKVFFNGSKAQLSLSNNTSSNYHGCAPFDVKFKIIHPENIGNFTVFFGDGTSEKATPASLKTLIVDHRYETPGEYWPSLRYSDSRKNCSNVDSLDSRIIVDHIKADFVIPPYDSCGKSIVQFIDKSKAEAFSEVIKTQWVFDDSKQDTVLGPLSKPYVYNKPGHYNVSMIALSKYGCKDTAVKTVTVWQKPGIRIKGDDITCLKPNSLLQYNAIVDSFASKQDSVQSYKWSIDGTSVGYNQNKLTFNLRVPGIHTIKLCVTTNHNCDSCIIKQIQIDSLKAEFSVDKSIFCGKGEVKFRNLSTASSESSYKWDFGNGISSNAKDTSILYTTPGNYPVYLYATSKYGCKDTMQYAGVIKIHPPVSASIVGDSINCKPQILLYSISSVSTDSLGSKKWYVDNTAVANNVNQLSYKFNAGSHLLKLIVSTIHGCADTAYKNVIVDSVVAQFSVLDPINCGDSAVVKFKNSSYAKFNIDRVTWNFGNLNGIQNGNDTVANLYLNKPLKDVNKYDVELIIKSKIGCTDTFRIPAAVTLLKTPNVLIDGDSLVCTPSLLKYRIDPASNINPFDLIDSISWGINSVKIPGENLEHFFNAGLYDVSLDIHTKHGCKASASKKLVVDSLKLDFEVNTKYLCGNNDSAEFKNASGGWSTIKNYYWDFGDGTTSIIKDPAHLYKLFQNVITYDVSLFVKSESGCMDTLVKKAFLTHYNLPQTSLVIPSKICAMSHVWLEPKTISADTIKSYEWLIDKKDVFTTQKVRYNFKTAGVHAVQLKVNTAHLCSYTLDTTVVVNPKPVPSATNDTIICKGNALQLAAYNGYSYEWTPARFLSNNKISHPLSVPDSTITYIVKVTNKFECTENDTVRIVVNDPLELRVHEVPTICKGEAIQLNARANTNLYKWSPSKGLNNDHIANPVASPSVTTLYQVTAFSLNICPDDTASILVKVGEIPLLKTVTDTAVVSGSVIQIHSSVTNVPVTYLWEPSHGLSCSDCPSPFINNIREDRIYTLTVTSQYGCQTQDTIKITVFCESQLLIPNSFTPNGDGLNEVFYPQAPGYGIVKSMLIFNRWGEKIFENENFPLNDPKYGWDGTFNNSPIEGSNVFVYVIILKCANGPGHSLTGKITLIR